MIARKVFCRKAAKSFAINQDSSDLQIYRRNPLIHGKGHVKYNPLMPALHSIPVANNWRVAGSAKRHTDVGGTRCVGVAQIKD